MSLLEQVRAAAAAKKILPSTLENLEAWIVAGFLPDWALASINELVEAGAWEELDNRFYKQIAFGTGGMRDKTIAARPTAAEVGTPNALGTPAFAAVGCAHMNDFNIARATIGLYRYCARHLLITRGYREEPRLVIAHDVRHFSRHFCELAASIWSQLGGTAFIFDGPRSTPQLSFTVRELKATAGVVITASHNPPADNGFKAYFEDGAQVVSPHAEGIIHEVYSVRMGELTAFLKKDLAKVVVLPTSLDEAYLTALTENIMSAETIRKARPKVVFTPIHGVGGISSVPALTRTGAEVIAVESQWKMDPRFPTVKSPNPENAEALTLALAKAREIGADFVVATDPDCDRMGVAVRDNSGDLVLLTGNQIGALLADFRITRLKELGQLPSRGSTRAAMIKTFVTTPLQDAIGKYHGIKVINTLTGFKFIADKILEWETLLQKELLAQEGIAIDYSATTAAKRAELLLKYSTWFLFGTEESYGYLASDRVRDKDGNAAVLLFTEFVATLKLQGKTVIDALDGLYIKHGFYLEGVINIYYEGASGAAKIKRILESYRATPPKKIGEYDVVRFDDFGVKDFYDADGKQVPKQDLYIVELDNGYTYAVRGSGTEPKIKFYIFANEDVPEPAALPQIKTLTIKTLDALKLAVDADARARAEG
ncbi:MAG: phospho-sugar mutase [Verrucomicrobiota bacterium]|nr:phospho-sugar mutase [Verrucomicrobiota bacterium]